MRSKTRAGRILPLLLVTGTVAFGFSPAFAQTAGTIGGTTIGQDQRGAGLEFGLDGGTREPTIVAVRPVSSAAPVAAVPVTRVQRTRSVGGVGANNTKRAFFMPWQTGVYN